MTDTIFIAICLRCFKVPRLKVLKAKTAVKRWQLCTVETSQRGAGERLRQQGNPPSWKKWCV